MIKCPLNCDPNYIIRHAEVDTPLALAYYCTACGKTFYLIKQIVVKE